MYKLTKEEFQDRLEALQRAKKIFNNLTDSNITASFEAYQAILAEKDRILRLNTAVHGNRPRTLNDDFIVPLCPECSTPMNIRPLPPKGKANLNGYGSAWYCPSCSFEIFNKDFLPTVVNTLERRDKSAKMETVILNKE